jgi:hypothetical protein
MEEQDNEKSQNPKIVVTEETKKRLDFLAAKKNETYNEILIRVLDALEYSHKKLYENEEVKE